MNTTSPTGLIARGSSAGTPVGLSGATSAVRFVGGTQTGAPTSGTFDVGDYVVAQDGGIFVCSAAGSPGTWSGTETVAHATATTTAINLSLDAALVRISALEAGGGGGGGGGGSGLVSGTWTASMVVECNNRVVSEPDENDLITIEDGELFTTTWSWVKLASFVVIKCTSITNGQGYATYAVKLKTDATSAHINCRTPLPVEIRPASWSSASDNITMWSQTIQVFDPDTGTVITPPGIDLWQNQSAVIQFSPNAITDAQFGYALDNGIRMYQIRGGNDFTGWELNNTDPDFRYIVFPTTAYIYGL